MQAIGWGIVGTGYAAHHFAEGLSVLPDARLAAVASRDRERAQAFASRWGVARAHAGYEALARDPEVDIVYVATPAPRHRDDCLLCLEAGKAVLCEKPFAGSAADARAIAGKARETGLFCMEAMWTRFLPAVRRARDLLRDGSLGEIEHFEASLGWLRADDGSDRLFSAALGGGALLDLGVYPLSLAWFLLGPPDGAEGTLIMHPSGVDASASMVLRYPRCLAVLSCSIRADLDNEAVLHGSKAQLRLAAPMLRPKSLLLRPLQPMPAPRPGAAATRSGLRRAASLPLVRALRRLLRGGGREAGKRLTPAQLGNGFNYEAAEAMRCLRAGLTESPDMPLQESVAILEVIDAIRADAASALRRAETP